MKTEYEIAEEIFNSGDYLNAFYAFKKITENNSALDEEKSDAYNMMGVIVLIDTRVENNDESGLEYFRKSLTINSQNVGALLNIIEGFGLSINNHKNIEMLDHAIHTLHTISYNLTPIEKDTIDRKIQLKDLLRKQNPH